MLGIDDFDASHFLLYILDTDKLYITIIYIPHA